MSVLLIALMLSAAQSQLDVKPGEPAIKDKDLYDATGYVHPFRRMPRLF